MAIQYEVLIVDKTVDYGLEQLLVRRGHEKGSLRNENVDGSGNID